MKTWRGTKILSITILMLGCFQISCSSLRKEANTTSQESRKNESDTSNIPTVEFCEVLRNPFPYQSKVIRIKGDLGRFQDYITFYDERCVPTHPLISVEFPSSSKSTYVNRTSDKLNQIIDGSAEAKAGKLHVIVSAIGLFERIPQSELKDYSELQYRFTIRKIEEVGNSAY